MLETRIDVKKTAVLLIDMQNDLIKTEQEALQWCNQNGRVERND